MVSADVVRNDSIVCVETRPRKFFLRSAWVLALSVTAAWLLVATTGCHSFSGGCGPQCIDAQLQQRTGAIAAPAFDACRPVLPNGADWADGLHEDEAVLLALWNNAAFREALVELNLAHADLVQAGLLPNPDVIYFFSAPDKPFKYAAEFPLEALWLRPIRVAAAERETYRVCHRLTQLGLDLIRDTRQAYADLSLAHARYHVAEEAVRLRDELAALAEARVAAGDISVHEATTARIDALTARQELTRIGYDRDFAEERLRNLMGIGDLRDPITLREPPRPLVDGLDADLLVAQAVVDRPDMAAADAAVAAARERLRLARCVWFRFLGIADASSGRDKGHELSPAFRLPIPLFNLNEGGVARAEAELEQAMRRRATLHDLIVMELRQALVRYEQALAERAILDSQIRPEVEAAIRRADAGYREGETSYVVALETTRQLIDARFREVQLKADLRRSWAEIERSVGRRLDDIPMPPDDEAVPATDELPQPIEQTSASDEATAI